MKVSNNGDTLMERDFYSYIIFDTNALFHAVYEGLKKGTIFIEEKVGPKFVYKFLLVHTHKVVNNIIDAVNVKMPFYNHFLFAWVSYHSFFDIIDYHAC